MSHIFASYRSRVSFMGCLKHDPANFQQMYSKYMC